MNSKSRGQKLHLLKDHKNIVHQENPQNRGLENLREKSFCPYGSQIANLRPSKNANQAQK